MRIELKIRRIKKIQVSLKFKPQDLWVGVYWEKSLIDITVWVCLVPMLPIKIVWLRGSGWLFDEVEPDVKGDSTWEGTWPPHISREEVMESYLPTQNDIDRFRQVYLNEPLLPERCPVKRFAAAEWERGQMVSPQLEARCVLELMHRGEHEWGDWDHVPRSEDNGEDRDHVGRGF